jgi:hypothetical protein
LLTRRAVSLAWVLLGSEAPDHVTGAMLLVDGGYLLT